MKLKYGKELARLANCPPDTAEPCERAAFRFVFDTIGDQRNFLPAAKMNPRRQFDDEYACCIAHALSMFASKKRATTRFRELLNAHKRIHLMIGTHLAEGNITADDGKATATDGRGHYSFFEAADCNCAETFKIIEKLYDA